MEAENPYLYQVILTMPDEVIVDRIGFRTIEIKDKVVYFNGEKIKFRGVNRHDSDPETRICDRCPADQKGFNVDEAA